MLLRFAGPQPDQDIVFAANEPWISRLLDAFDGTVSLDEALCNALTKSIVSDDEKCAGLSIARMLLRKGALRLRCGTIIM